MLTIQTLMTCLSEESTIGKVLAQIDSDILSNAYHGGTKITCNPKEHITEIKKTLSTGRIHCD